MSLARKPPTPLEAGIQRTMLATLRHYGVLCWRNNTGAVQAEYKGRKRFIRYGEVGHSDIFFVLPPRGRFGALEVKRPGNRPTDDQIGFLQRVGRAGGLGFWADDPAIVERIIRVALADPRIRVEVRADGSQELTDEPIPA